MGQWSGTELQTLRTLWATATTQELIVALPNRSLASIAGKASALKLGRRDKNLGRIDAKADIGTEFSRINVGIDPLLARLRKHHAISEVKEFSL